MKIAFVTGANRGLGWETARELGQAGVFVVLGIRHAAKIGEALVRIKDAGVENVDAIAFDLDNLENHTKAAEYFGSKFGRLDILVNNAAIFPLIEKDGVAQKQIPTSEVPMAMLRAAFDTNFFNTIALTQTLLPLIRKSPAGRIVNLSSSLGSLTYHTQPGSHVYGYQALPYDASKTALNAFTVHLAYELKDTSIKVNSAHPGWVKTEMGGPDAMLEVSEGAKTSVQLALLPDDGPTGGYFHLGKALPW